MNISEMTFNEIANGENIETEQDEKREHAPRDEKSFWDILKIKTGQGDVSDYMDNPLNYDKSEDTAQIIRGATGFLGDLDLFWIDILFGAFRKLKPQKQQGVANE